MEAPLGTPTTSNAHAGSLADLGERYVIREACVGDAFSVLPDLREADRLEWAASIAGGVDHLYESIAVSKECYAVTDVDDGVAHIIFGVVTEPEPTVWLLGTNQGQRQAAWLLHGLREFYTEFFSRWPRLVCYSAPGNTVHHRWLQWMGFRFVRGTPRGDFGAQFYEYRKGEA